MQVLRKKPIWFQLQRLKSECSIGSAWDIETPFNLTMESDDTALLIIWNCLKSKLQVVLSICHHNMGLWFVKTHICPKHPFGPTRMFLPMVFLFTTTPLQGEFYFMQELVNVFQATGRNLHNFFASISLSLKSRSMWRHRKWISLHQRFSQRLRGALVAKNVDQMSWDWRNAASVAVKLMYHSLSPSLGGQRKRGSGRCWAKSREFMPKLRIASKRARQRHPGVSLTRWRSGGENVRQWWIKSQNNQGCNEGQLRSIGNFRCNLH